MFVRIKGENRKTTLTECREIDIHDEGPGYLLFVLKDGNFSKNILVDKAADEVYITNNSGETIDSYRWGLEDTGQIDNAGNRILSGARVRAEISDSGDKEAPVKSYTGIVERGHGGQWTVNFDNTEVVSSKALIHLAPQKVEVISGEDSE